MLPIGSGLSANYCGLVVRKVVAQVLTTCLPAGLACWILMLQQLAVPDRCTHRRTLHVRYAHAHNHTHRIRLVHAIQAYNTRVEYR